MKCLEDIESELVVARRFVDCALLASRQLTGSGAEALSAVLFDAGDKIRESIEDIATLRGLIYVPAGAEQ